MIYIVTFEIHKDCAIHEFVYHCKAKNAKEACATAREAWASDGHTGYMFHLHGTRSRVQDASLLHVVTWKGTHRNGEEVMNTFISTDSRTWRVSGRNLYCW